MIQKKICLLGAFAVGKTSLVSRYVHSMFSDQYHTTVGVKIDKKVIAHDENEVNLVIWDLAGEDDIVRVRSSYFRGAAGYLLVVDGTRTNTVQVANLLRDRIHSEIGPLPHVILANKSDLAETWEATDAELDALSEDGKHPLFRTSAKTGIHVEDAFSELTRRMMDR